VENARRDGWSWSEVAQPLGVTRQAVHNKYARRLESSSQGARHNRIVVSGGARRCVVRARREAAAFGHETVGTDHLLLGLLAQEEIARALAPLEIELARVLFVVAASRGKQRRPRRERAGSGPIPVSESARAALEQSLREALRLGDDTIAARHIFLALLREEQGAAARVLDRLGIAPAAVEACLRG
jgi:ATP-dependent Clp protease ATP-binding subunit ClpA